MDSYDHIVDLYEQSINCGDVTLTVPGADPDEPFLILTEVRDNAIGKNWPLYEAENENEVVPPDTVFAESAKQLHRVLLSNARSVRKRDPAKAERLSRLAERRAKDADDIDKMAEAIIEMGVCQLMMNNLNNAQKTFERAFKIHSESMNIVGLCETRMHLAAVMQKLGDHEKSAKLLTEMGALAMENSLRRELGRALHLLGELHLRRERPELGTQHLAEAFSCFMGNSFQKTSLSQYEFVHKKPEDTKGDFIFQCKKIIIYEEEAEQSRLMMAISAGQELMASYFSLLREAGGCAVAQTKTIEWKLSHAGWWIRKKSHDFVPCLCKKHNRTPLDILKLQLILRKASSNAMQSEGDGHPLGRTDTVDDMRKLRSGYQDYSNNDDDVDDADVNEEKTD